jgi:hypothetical protein
MGKVILDNPYSITFRIPFPLQNYTKDGSKNVILKYNS